MTKSQKKLWIGLFILTLLTPLGVILPEKFKAGGAWGEWGAEELEKLVGYVPEGLKRLSELWKAPAPDYNFGGEGASMTVQVISYIASGLIGILAVALVIYVIARLILKNEK
ncbi:MAG: cobalamin biosynthesis protein [Nitrospirae bacterium CG_4_10_14_3_um_filter_44_29]|nr:cobalamin biosynthesis protein [Nitrospirota bacterium]PIV65968.1 MAG: cobalamin biosynthesis protein [Nitrospirae bacterium CG01_land_8_20_14_3_00_44_22]PIX89124.1 MAG: cobalamin biosynthesis protein [Nitrospirae bacterium CG_4_10_14_3_um_filter_44_29]